MPLDKAALIGCSVMTGVGAVINTANVPVGASLAVFGCGGVGLNAVQGGVLAGAHPIIAIDIVDGKLELATRLGATHRLRADQDDVAQALRDITGRGLDYAIVAVGNAWSVQQAWAALAPGGTCVMLGIMPSGEHLSIDPTRLYGTENRLIGSRYGSALPSVDFPRLVDLYLAGKLHLDELITRRYPLQAINEAHRALAAGENARGLLVY
jgi:S-(hydroxymethyl)glutathione dehydrogenase/alcohol dehydrogenase